MVMDGIGSRREIDMRYGQVGHTNIVSRIEVGLGHFLGPSARTELEPLAGDLAFVRSASEHEERARVWHTAMVTVDFQGVGDTAAAKKVSMDGYEVLATHFSFLGVVLTSAKTTTLTVSGACSVMNSGRGMILCGEAVFFLFPRGLHEEKLDAFLQRYACAKQQAGRGRKAIVVGERVFREWLMEYVSSLCDNNGHGVLKWPETTEKDVSDGDSKMGEVGPRGDVGGQQMVRRMLTSYHFLGTALTTTTPGSYVHLLLKH